MGKGRALLPLIGEVGNESSTKEIKAQPCTLKVTIKRQYDWSSRVHVEG